MKRKILYYCIAALFLAACEPEETPEVEPQEPEVTTLSQEDQTVITKTMYGFSFEKLRAMPHPRLFIDSLGFEILINQVNNERASRPVHAALHDAIISNADKYASVQTSPISYKLDASGKRILDQARLALQRIAGCSYAYKTTKKQQYLKSAVRDLEVICNFKDWHPSHFLDAAELMLAAAIGYDWLYSDLSEGMRDTLCHRLIRYGLYSAYDDDSSFKAKKTNWNQVCYGGLASAAVAVYGSKVDIKSKEYGNKFVSEMIEDAVYYNSQSASAIYDTDGNYSEGYGYWDYGTLYQTVLIEAVANVFGYDSKGVKGYYDLSGFKTTADWMLFMEGVTGPFPYADGGRTSTKRNWQLFWFATRMNNNDCVVREVGSVLKGKYSSETHRLFPLSSIWLSANETENYSGLSYPKDSLWCGAGKAPVMLCRTSWTGGEEDVYVAAKGGYFGAGHQHMDNGSFVFDCKGTRWADDMVIDDYTTYENLLAKETLGFWSYEQMSTRWNILYQNALMHNVLSVAEGDPGARRYVTDLLACSEKSKVGILSQVHSSTELGAVFDITPAYSDKLSSGKRTVKIVKDEKGSWENLVVSDALTVKGDAPLKMMWHMTTKASAEVKDDCIVLSRSGKTMKLSTDIPSAKYFSMKAERPSSWDHPEYAESYSGYTVVGFYFDLPTGAETTVTTRIYE